jgi:hypothetical protein
MSDPGCKYQALYHRIEYESMALLKEREGREGEQKRTPQML